MSFCASTPANHQNCVSTQVLKLTARRLRTILQGWMACYVNAGWMSHEKMYDHAQEGGLLYPIGLLGVDYHGTLFKR